MMGGYRIGNCARGHRSMVRVRKRRKNKATGIHPVHLCDCNRVFPAERTIAVNPKEQRKAFRPDTPEPVRDFYEKMPYPAPLASLDEYQDLYRNPDRRRTHFHLMWPTEQPCEKQEILIAGCGTSQAARYALREPHSRITAIDISETSLNHTRDLQQRYDLQNLDVHPLAIEHVRELERSFDLIVCTGVLHHLRDPAVGLRALRTVLRPHGAMRLMVYARYGRTGISMMQEYCRLLGIIPSDDELRGLGATLKSLPEDHPISGLLSRAKDFRQPDAMADALLHPRDRAYSVPEVYSLLEQCGMSFGRWIEQAPYLAQCGIVGKSPHTARLAALPSQLQHAAVELFRGTMVSHSFIAYRDDRPAEAQPITFTGDRCRDYVPVLVPWAARVREHVPMGGVAVLINRAHTFTDLICTVDRFEDHLLQAIDGKRTLNEIMRSAGVDRGAEHSALSFFERLWQYDQVVFDASRTADQSGT
jgi:2-polyprenyl-3-methyl-5-hydroxy-6-metoxy-1,4-benzoquinol methylase